MVVYTYRPSGMWRKSAPASRTRNDYQRKLECLSKRRRPCDKVEKKWLCGCCDGGAAEAPEVWVCAAPPPPQQPQDHFPLSRHDSPRRRSDGVWYATYGRASGQPPHGHRRSHYCCESISKKKSASGGVVGREGNVVAQRKYRSGRSPLLTLYLENLSRDDCEWAGNSRCRRTERKCCLGRRVKSVESNPSGRVYDGERVRGVARPMRARAMQFALPLNRGLASQ